MARPAQESLVLFAVARQRALGERLNGDHTLLVRSRLRRFAHSRIRINSGNLGGLYPDRVDYIRSRIWRRFAWYSSSVMSPLSAVKWPATGRQMAGGASDAVARRARTPSIRLGDTSIPGDRTHPGEVR